MPEHDPNEWVRAKDRELNRNVTIRRSALPHGKYTDLKADAVDIAGEPLPPEFLEDAAPAQSTTKKD